mmetsp:Transcript_74187/g.146983  ORF Transcript_74187/g.146983 Transcript_74187/m.146983 type:complete len:276 (-) Transcript_74187:21-848(-)
MHVAQVPSSLSTWSKCCLLSFDSSSTRRTDSSESCLSRRLKVSPCTWHSCRTSSKSFCSCGMNDSWSRARHSKATRTWFSRACSRGSPTLLLLPTLALPPKPEFSLDAISVLTTFASRGKDALEGAPTTLIGKMMGVLLLETPGVPWYCAASCAAVIRRLARGDLLIVDVDEASRAGCGIITLAGRLLVPPGAISPLQEPGLTGLLPMKWAEPMVGVCDGRLALKTQGGETRQRGTTCGDNERTPKFLSPSARPSMATSGPKPVAIALGKWGRGQ